MQLKNFGAVGDGVADDTEALQGVLREGGEVRIPRGTYRLTQPLVAELNDAGPLSIAAEGGARLIMTAPGPALRLVGTLAGSADPKTIPDSIWAHERMPLVDGLEILGAHPEADGVELDGTMQATLSRLLVRGCRHGVRVVNRNRNVIVSHCHLYRNRQTGLFLDAVNLHQINVVGSHISYNARGGIVVRASEIRNLQITGNDIEYNYDPGEPESADIWIETGSRSVREATIASNTIQAIPSPGGANIRVVGQSAEAPHKAGLICITGNLISSQETLVHLRWARGITLTGNAFQSARQYTLLAQESSGLVVGANLFDRNPDYGTDYRDGIRLERCRATVLAGLQMTGCSAGDPDAGGCIDLRACEDVCIRDVQILDPEHRGIEVRDSHHCSIQGCHIRDRRRQPTMQHAVRVVGGGANWVAGNYLDRGLDRALHLEAGSGQEQNNNL